VLRTEPLLYSIFAEGEYWVRSVSRNIFEQTSGFQLYLFFEVKKNKFFDLKMKVMRASLGGEANIFFICQYKK
jgi:hypothetical protein